MLSPDDRPSPSTEAVLRRFGAEEPLLFHPLFGEVVALTPSGFAIWQCLDGRRSVSEIAERVTARCDAAPTDVLSDVTSFLFELRRRGFVVTDPAADTPRQERAGSGPVGDPPVVGEASAPALERAALSLADGRRFRLVASDETAGEVLARFAASASLDAAFPARAGDAGVRELRIATVPDATRALPPEDVLSILPPGVDPSRPGKAGREGRRRRPVPPPPTGNEWLWLQLVRLSGFLGRHAQEGGGLLLHSALAHLPPREGRPGGGVLLAGRSGVGKSTASRRLPPPWQALCDDATLVVRDGRGRYLAHPWPTWSRVFAGHLDDRWDVQSAVPLRAVCVLEQAEADQLRPARVPEAVSLLMELSRQATHRLWLPGRVGLDLLRRVHTQRFENACALAAAVPADLLDLSLHGPFWTVLEGRIRHDEL